ncbi:MAG: FAD:protein FMN transferase [Pseudomonadota bacterium]
MPHTLQTGNQDALLRRIYGAALILLSLLYTLPAQAQWHRQHWDMMGTRISVELWHPDLEQSTQCSLQIESEMQRLDARLSSYRDSSELSYINKNAAVKTVTISEEMQHLIDRSIFFSEVSKGVFDITYASIGYAYDYRNAKQPDNETVAATLDSIDYRHIQREGDNIRFRNSGVRINLGGIAKGYAVDQAIEIIEKCGISKAMISAGGDSRILGDRGGRPWIIGIQHPRNPDQVALRLPLSNTAVSTSGDYQRFFIDQGDRIHHIINPQTGRSAKGSWSATVTGPDAMTTDALSTTIFIMGAENGIEFVERLEGIDAILIDSNGKVHYSSGFQPPDIEGQ